MSRINRLTTERNDLELECMHKDARIASLMAEVERLKQIERLADDLVIELISGRNNTITAVASDAIRALISKIGPTR
jgi:hypothetical protein